MTEITHQTARALLQSATDQNLDPIGQTALEAHLSACSECAQYARQLAQLETNLRDMFQNKWKNLRPEIDLRAIRHPSPLKQLWNNLFARTHTLGKASAIVALLVSYFVLANLFGVWGPIGGDETPTALPTPKESTSTLNISPTPSIPVLQNEGPTQACQTMIYVVKENDTLERIALQYGVTKELILEYNPGDTNLENNTVSTNMKLVIPLCKSTPANTTNAPNNTLTITPIYGTILPGQNE